MKEADLTVTFGPTAGDRSTLSKSGRATLDALYRHPVAHNLEWTDVVALFEKIGTVDHKAHDEIAFGIGGTHHVFRKPRHKDLTTAEIMDIRHMLSRAGWSPQAATGPNAEIVDPTKSSTAIKAPPDLLVVMDHREARLYHLEINSADHADHVIRPYDPHHFLHHLSHKDQPRERGQRTPEDHSFYEHIAQAVSPGRRIVLIGHGHGHSNAADHLAEYLRHHHPETFKKIASDIVADLSALTVPQLLDRGRRALTVKTA